MKKNFLKISTLLAIVLIMAVAVITSCNDKTPASVPDRFSYKSWLEGTWTGTISDPSSSGAIELRFNNGQIYVSIPQLQLNYDLATNLKLNKEYLTSFSEEATDDLYSISYSISRQGYTQNSDIVIRKQSATTAIMTMNNQSSTPGASGLFTANLTKQGS